MMMRLLLVMSRQRLPTNSVRLRVVGCGGGGAAVAGVCLVDGVAVAVTVARAGVVAVAAARWLGRRLATAAPPGARWAYWAGG